MGREMIDSPYGRSVEEWKGATPDSMPPPHVRMRIFDRHHGVCHISGRKIRAGEPWDADHVIAIVNGGENRERNMAPALKDKHQEKTAADRAEKADVDHKRLKHLSIREPKRKWASRNSFKRQDSNCRDINT